MITLLLASSKLKKKRGKKRQRFCKVVIKGTEKGTKRNMQGERVKKGRKLARKRDKMIW